MDGMDYLPYILEYIWQHILTEGLMFWVLLFFQWGLFTWLFCRNQRDWDDEVLAFGYNEAVAHSVLWGVLSMGMPVLLAGLWIDGYFIWAWVVNLAPVAVFTAVIGAAIFL